MDRITRKASYSLPHREAHSSQTFFPFPMASLKDLLPAPTDGHTIHDENPNTEPPKLSTVIPATPQPNSGTTTVIALKPSVVSTIDVAHGGDGNGSNNLDYSAIVLQGENATRTVHTRYDGMVEKPRTEALQTLPNAANVAEATRKTKAALEKSLSTKLAPSSSAKRSARPSFIRYTPANATHKRASGSAANANVSARPQQRIIKMVEAQRDPMEPPRFSQRKAPVNPPSPPVPVLHSPERPLTKPEAAEWRIPPVVSDWKNNRGYTISLDKRLAADGRSLVDRSVNDRFADMAEALYQAEKSARAEVERRAGLQQMVSRRAKAAREQELRELAERARRERKGFLALSERTDAESVATGAVSDAPIARPAARFSSARGGGSGAGVGIERQVEDDAPPLLGLGLGLRGRSGDSSHASAQQMRPFKRQRHDGRDADRDVSERLALGHNVANAAPSGELLYDERLFNQDGRSGRGERRANTSMRFRADDAY